MMAIQHDVMLSLNKKSLRSLQLLVTVHQLVQEMHTLHVKRQLVTWSHQLVLPQTD